MSVGETRTTMPVRAGGTLGGAAIAEAIGTYILVLFGAGAVVAVGTTAEAAETSDVGAALTLFGLAAIGLAFAFAIVVVVYAFGHVSGAHVNPAVTIALAATRKFPLAAVPTYIGAQFVGAILAALTLYVVFPNSAADEPLSLGATVPGVGDGLALITEIAITFVLLVVIMATATDERATPPATGLAIGLTIGAGVIATLPVSGGSFNPARSLGPMIVAWDFPGWWLYIVGPIFGALIGALLYDAVVRSGSPPEPAGAIEERPKASGVGPPPGDVPRPRP